MADVSESWTDEFDSLQSRIESHIGPSASSMHPPASRQEGPHMQKVLREERMPIQEIEAELKLLEWHKMANEAALKAALVRTKQLKASNRLDRKKDQVFHFPFFLSHFFPFFVSSPKRLLGCNNT